MLLELITGRRPVDTTPSFSEDSLVDWARPLLARAMEDGTLDALVDPRIQNSYNKSEMMRVVACAASCVRHSWKVMFLLMIFTRESGRGIVLCIAH